MSPAKRPAAQASLFGPFRLRQPGLALRPRVGGLVALRGGITRIVVEELEPKADVTVESGVAVTGACKTECGGGLHALRHLPRVCHGATRILSGAAEPDCVLN